MSSLAILDFLFDDDNEEEMARHGITPEMALQILENPMVVLPNRKDRRAKYLIIGRDRGGACLAVPVEPTHEPSLWRPVTAWRCKEREHARLGEVTR